MIQEQIKIVDICDYHLISRSQRESEIAKGLGTKGTMSFENKGCYDCQGYNPTCDAYQSELKEV